jgi:predicted porin
MDFRGPIGFKISRYDAYERYLDQGFRYSANSGSFYASWVKWLLFYGSFQRGASVNYSPARGLDPFLASSQYASFGFTLRPTPRIRIEENYYFIRLGARTGAELSGGKPTVFNNHLVRTKLNYQFTRALSLRGILDYYALLPNTDLINSERYKQLTGDILVTYLLNPGTALYVGYNDRRENFANDPEARPGLRRYGPPTYLSGRQVFVKLSYLLRF